VCLSRQIWLKLSWKVDECKPLPLAWFPSVQYSARTGPSLSPTPQLEPDPARQYIGTDG